MKATVTISEDLERDLKAYLETHQEPLDKTLQQALREYLERRSLASVLSKAGLEYRLPRRPLGSFTVAEKGSGKGDISINHDKYLAEFTYERKLPRQRDSDVTPKEPEEA